MESYLIKTRLRGHDFIFKTRAGVFSKHQVDVGTNLLIESLDVKPNDVVLDLGCGYGAVGIVAAGLTPGGKSILVDANIRAVRLAQENVVLNKIGNAEVRLSDGLEAVINERFDVIASNPPASSGLGLFDEFAQDAKECLKPGGKIYFVTQERLKPAVERLFTSVFGNYELAKRSRGYIISVARKETL
jgi:16S rRNA (guanine1207-N2)-methyltransferase